MNLSFNTTSMKIRWAILIIAFLAVESCDNKQYPYVPENVRNTLDRSGRNYIEFLEAIVKYRNPDDSLKLESLYYLAAHMPIHGYRTYLLQDENGMLIDFNIRDYKNLQRILEIRDSIKMKHGQLYFIRHYLGKDVYVVESDFMQQLVDSGLHTWKTKPWSSGYSFEVFKKKILPKRLNSGPLDDWMTIVKDTLLPGFNTKADDPFVAADQIYNRLKGFLLWDERYTQNPTDQGWAEMNKHRNGRSEDAAVLLTAAFRSYGIAAAIDFIPLPIESTENATYWVVVWDAQGNKRYYYPFSDSLKKPSGFPKVFRRTYHSYHPGTFPDSILKKLKYQHLEQRNYKDVTDEYTPTKSFNFEPVQEPSKPFSKVFLCFEYEGDWIPAGWKYYSKEILFNKLKIGQRYALTDKYGNILYEMDAPLQ